jgi:hypothetical protein
MRSGIMWAVFTINLLGSLASYLVPNTINNRFSCFAISKGLVGILAACYLVSYGFDDIARFIDKIKDK